MVTNKDILARVYSQGFNSSDFYIIILRTALKNKDFFKWWRSYGFNIDIFVLNK